MRLRWKLDPRATGLARVVAGPRGSSLRDESGKRYAAVSGLRFRDGWFWVAGWDSDVPYMNTCEAPCSTVEEAKAQALAYVKSHLLALKVTP